MLTLNNQDITRNISDRLISLSLSDNLGFEANQLDIELDDSDGLIELPVRAPPKAKPVKAKKAPKGKEAREGECMVGEEDNVFALTTIYASKAQAMRAAQARWDKLQRGVAEFSISLAMGRADLHPETPVAVSGFKRVIDEQAWTITKVMHSLSNNDVFRA